MTIEPEPPSSGGIPADRSGRDHSMSRFPARAVGNLNGLTRLPRPELGRWRPTRQWDPGVSILLPRLDRLCDRPCLHRETEQGHRRSELTLLELSLILGATAGAWSDPQLPDCLELGVLAFRVQGVPPAGYRYLPMRHALVAPTELEPGQRPRGESSASDAAMTLTITSRPALRGAALTSAYTPRARLAARLVTDAAISAASTLGLTSYHLEGEHEGSYRVALWPLTGPSAPDQR
jgi:hypothetical protein